MTQTVLTNETQVQEFFDRMFRSSTALVSSLKTEPEADIPTRFLDANTGVCYGRSKDTYTMKSGQVVEMKVRWSATVVKEGGEWKVALAHVGADFLDNPVLEGVKGFAKKLGLGACVGGLLVGLVAGWLMGRGKRASWPAAQQPEGYFWTNFPAPPGLGRVVSGVAPLSMVILTGVFSIMPLGGFRS